MRQLGEEYQRRLQVAAAQARLEVQQQAAAERRQLQLDAAAERQEGMQLLQEQRAAAAAAEAEDEEGAAVERARHAAELARLGEQHATELNAVKVHACCCCQVQLALHVRRWGADEVADSALPEWLTAVLSGCWVPAAGRVCGFAGRA